MWIIKIKVFYETARKEKTREKNYYIKSANAITINKQINVACGEVLREEIGKMIRLNNVEIISKEKSE